MPAEMEKEKSPEEVYELVDVDPVRELKHRGTELEKEIDAIKDVLKETLTISKMTANADELVSKIIEMIKVSQDMVEAVSKSNEKVGSQLNESIKQMNSNNIELSHKLDALLEFFAETAEAEEKEEPKTAEIDEIVKRMDRKMDEIGKHGEELYKKTSALEKRVETLSRGMTRPRPIPRAPSLAPAPPRPLTPKAFKPPEG